MTEHNDYLERLDDLMAKAKKAGADAADAIMVSGVSLDVSRRLGETEHLERSEGFDVGLRVLVGQKQAIVSSSDLSPTGLSDLPSRAVTMAKSVPDDPYCGLAEPELLAREIADLDMCDGFEPPAETLLEWANEAEEAALAVSGVTNSEGGQASWGLSTIALAATNGISHGYQRSSFSIAASVLAGEGTGMERDYDYTSVVHAEDLEGAAQVGQSAGNRAVRRLNPRRPETAQVPVVYHPRVSGSLIGHLASAVNGSAVARGTTFLKDKMGKRIFADSITITDDPLRRRGLRSKPFDAEGVATTRRNIIENGELTTWILDLGTARQLGLQTTGNASRGTSSPPGPSTTNLYLQAGKLTPQELMADIGSGFYVTELIGFGVNMVTGDYSRGASGFWIENGKITYPVSEITVAGNLGDIFANISAANDLKFRYGTDAPTLRVDGMTVAGA
ncbi:MAG: TldD/PmbA family protein [Rhodospirillales bacterium]|jgi:PmbA protein|nr:TldD/PmbA family protein [Rhodospirillales bacterium]